MNTPKILAIAVSAALLAACGSDDNDNDDKKVVNAPETYTFPSKVTAGASSVSYSGQVARNVLINELKNMMNTGDIANDLGDNDGQTAAKDAVVQKLNLVFQVGTTDEASNLQNTQAYTLAASTVTPVGITPKTENVTLKQNDYANADLDNKNLFGKLAGEDNDLARGEFIGWTVAISGDQTENDKPKLLVEQWFDAFATNAAAGSANVPSGNDGFDYRQLTHKFLLGAVSFSQASNDYLKATKGLLKQNSAGDKDGTKPYTSLEHQWDEGFGYFGAARDYNDYTDEHIGSKKQQDNNTNKDTEIDLTAEYTFAMAQYANKRDYNPDSNTDFSKTIMDGFLKGRQLIQDNYGTDPVEGEGYHAELAEIAKGVIMAWEQMLAANTIHYINETLKVMEQVGDQADKGNLPKYWGEMKGFALALQFNQQSTSAITNAQLKTLNDHLGQTPILTNDADYRASLVSARDLLSEVFAFADDGDVTKW